MIRRSTAPTIKGPVKTFLSQSVAFTVEVKQIGWTALTKTSRATKNVSDLNTGIESNREVYRRPARRKATIDKVITDPGKAHSCLRPSNEFNVVLASNQDQFPSYPVIVRDLRELGGKISACLCAKVNKRSRVGANSSKRV